LTVSVSYLTGPADTAYNGPVAVALLNPDGAAFGGTLLATPKNGVATFNGLPSDLNRMIGGPTPNIRVPSGALRYIGARSDVHLRSEARP
jgi:hypothetical protein